MGAVEFDGKPVGPAHGGGAIALRTVLPCDSFAHDVPPMRWTSDSGTWLRAADEQLRAQLTLRGRAGTPTGWAAPCTARRGAGERVLLDDGEDALELSQFRTRGPRAGRRRFTPRGSSACPWNGMDGLSPRGGRTVRSAQQAREFLGIDPELAEHRGQVVPAQLIRSVTQAPMADAHNKRAQAAVARLSSLSERERERDVAVAVGQGKSNAEMARELFMSLPTVKAHVSHIFVKLQLVNRVQIAICVHEAGRAGPDNSVAARCRTEGIRSP
jgi:DNA-binding CsgD family transcriptional regulator